MTGNSDIQAYYARRAHEYERIYHRPLLREEYAKLFRWMAEALSDLDVLEIACGTGYWTRPLSEIARSVLATDAVNEVLNVARAKGYPRGNVRFMQLDAFELPGADLGGAMFPAALAAFWWSHLTLDRRTTFLAALHTRLARGGTVVLADNLYVEGVSSPLSRRDNAGNTYQLRGLDDGTSFEIVKNYPTRAALDALIEPWGVQIEHKTLKHFWFVSYHAR